MILFAVCNHSPLQTTQWLKTKKIEPKFTEPTKRSRGLFYYFDYAQYRSNKEVQESKASIVLFCGPIVARKIVNINLLDITINEDAPYYGIQYCKLDSKVFCNAKHDLYYHDTKYDYADAIIKVVESKSLLGSLMTAIYTLPNSIQKPVKIALIDWLCYDGSLIGLNTLMSKLIYEYRLRLTSVTQLSEILQSELATQYCEALKKGGDAIKLAAEYSISAYDINYMLSVKSTKVDYGRNNNV